MRVSFDSLIGLFLLLIAEAKFVKKYIDGNVVYCSGV